MSDEEAPSVRQRDLAQWIINDLAQQPGSRAALAVELPKLSVRALEELRNALRHLLDEAASERIKRRRGF